MVTTMNIVTIRKQAPRPRARARGPPGSASRMHVIVSGFSAGIDMIGLANVIDSRTPKTPLRNQHEHLEERSKRTYAVVGRDRTACFRGSLSSLNLPYYYAKSEKNKN